MTLIKKFEFEEGKYTIERDARTGLILTIKRYDKYWHCVKESIEHMKLFHAMLNKIEDLENEIIILKR
jgi:hypothetical protein